MKIQILKGKKKTYTDKSAFIAEASQKPEDAIDYASDEFSADYLGKKGKVLKSVESDQSGLAHQLVSMHFL